LVDTIVLITPEVRMIVYGIIMGQAVTVADVTGKALTTGYDKGGALQSCSAVILFNSNSLAAGLYHYPAGKFDNDKKSRKLLDKMSALVNPTEAYIAFGVTDTSSMAMAMTGIKSSVPLDETYPVLKSYILKELLPTEARLKAMPALNGRATISLSHGQASVSLDGIDPDVDLSATKAGSYTDYTVLWDS
jgi:hypothetical protein